MTPCNCTITVLPDVLTFVHIPRILLRQFSHYLVKQILIPAPSFLNITCNKVDLLLFCHYSALQDFGPFTRTGRDAATSGSDWPPKANRVASHHLDAAFHGPSAVSADAIEVSHDTWNVLQLDSHNDRLDNAGARIKELSAILAEAGISIMYQSSYTSDFIFVKSSRLPQVLARLAQAGFVGYSFDNLSSLLHNEVPLIPLKEEDPMVGVEAPSSSGLVFEHNPNITRSLSSDAGIPSSLGRNYYSRSMAGGVEILDQDLVCVGLSESFADTWSSKIIKLVAYPELIFLHSSANSTHGKDTHYPEDSPHPYHFSDDGLPGTHRELVLNISPREDFWIDSPIALSSPTRVDSSSCSEKNSAITPHAVLRSVLNDRSPLQHSQSLPEMSSFGQHPCQKAKGLLEATIPSNDETVLFFSFTRTTEGSSLTTSRKHITALFPSSERHMIICGDELDVEDGDDYDPFFGSDPSEDLVIMKCLQLDIQRFGSDRHGIISSYSKILDSNGINHMYSSTYKTANLLVNRLDARRAAALLQSC